jgi:Fic family protein
MNIDSNIINSYKIENLEIFQPNKKLFIALAKKDRVDFIYNTSALEGNAMTYPEVETLLDGITIGGHKLSDEQQILNQNRSLNLLFEMLEKKIFKVDKATLLALHKKVAFEEALSWGEFRRSGVNIGGCEYLPPKASELDSIFQAGIIELKKINNTILKALTYFLFGAKNQFFYDGNKRVSRLMMNGILLDGGYPILNIKAKDKLEFNTQMIKFYDSDDMRETLIYLTNYYIKQNRFLVE